MTRNAMSAVGHDLQQWLRVVLLCGYLLEMCRGCLIPRRDRSCFGGSDPSCLETRHSLEADVALIHSVFSLLARSDHL